MDIMHLKKNIFDNVLRMLINIKGKIKYTIKAHQDLCQMGLEKELHLKKDGDSYLMPHAFYKLPCNEKQNFVL